MLPDCPMMALWAGGSDKSSLSKQVAEFDPRPLSREAILGRQFPGVTFTGPCDVSPMLQKQSSGE
jgi:hypothetical protein